MNGLGTTLRAEANVRSGPISASIARVNIATQRVQVLAQRLDNIADRAFGTRPEATAGPGNLVEACGLMGELLANLAALEEAVTRAEAMADRLDEIA